MLKTLIISMLLLAVTGIHDFKLKTLDGKPMDMAQFKGKKLLIVNTASKCGYTKQYADLQELHEKFGSKITVVGFPANNFGGQEPGSNEEIASFCKKNFGVSFPMAEKVSVKGSDIHPLFKYLTEEAGKMGVKEPIKWNFTKFLIDENGKLLEVFPSGVKPTDEAITKYLN
jgi:glutathione peroxidase